jgi:hypothetical protein
MKLLQVTFGRGGKVLRSVEIEPTTADCYAFARTEIENARTCVEMLKVLAEEKADLPFLREAIPDGYAQLVEHLVHAAAWREYARAARREARALPEVREGSCL